MKSKSKIYTKTGDDGETSLSGGTRVPKFHKRIKGYGSVDELNSYVGLLRDLINNKDTKEKLLRIQEVLFIIQSHLASENEKTAARLENIKQQDIIFLENEIDAMNSTLPEIKAFILPGGYPTSSYCHIARCICRRAERIIIEVASQFGIDRLIIIYLNRLSDYLFVLARKIVADNKGEEILWKAKR